MEKLHQLSTSAPYYRRWKQLTFILLLFTLSWGLQAQIYGPGPYSYDLVVAPGEAVTLTIQAWAGGGGGGNKNIQRQGGGGGGGYFTNTYELGPGNYVISGTVGAGGTPGNAGGNTSYNISGPGINVTGTLGGGTAGDGQQPGLGGSGQVPGGDGGGTGTGSEDTGGGGGGSGIGATAGGKGGSVAGGNGGTPGGGDGGANGASGLNATGPGGGGGGKGYNGASSGSGGDGQVSLEIVLPVELAFFDATPKEDMVALAWSTSSELNNDFFQIEHSKDAVNFTSVGKISGKGTTTETVNYEFMHRQPTSGVNYYRLKQVDFDGAFEYSPVVVVQLDDRTGGAVNVYPNPTIDRAVVTFGERPENVKFTFTNLLGQGIDLQPVSTTVGWELDLSQLGSGVYVLRAEYDGKVLTRQIVKN